MTEDKENELLLYSESFPLNEKNERQKMKPIAECHKLLKGVTIDPNRIVYKPLTPENLEEVKKLHVEWFPVKYDEEIFNQSLLYNQGRYFTVAAFYYIQTGENEYKEIILGLIICQWVYVDEYFFKMTTEETAKKISDNLNYEEEVKFLFSCDKYYYCAYIMSLGVIDECRKMGIGSNMLRSIFNYAIYSDICVGVYLHVISSNVSGKKFYEKNGFVKVNNLKDFYDIEGKKYESDVYIKIFTRKEKDSRSQYIYSMMTFKQKCINICILKPLYFIIKILMFIFCLQCFRNKIRTK